MMELRRQDRGSPAERPLVQEPTYVYVCIYV